MTDTSEILIVGSMAIDDLELPSGKFNDVVGGAATYAAYSASLFTKASIVAVVGRDFPKADLERLEKRGVDLSGVEHAAGETFRWAGRYAANLTSRETLDTRLNVFADFRPKLPASYKSSPLVLLGNIQPDLQLEVLDQVKSPKFVAADTMNFWIEGERPSLLRVLARIDALVINDEELRQLANEHNIKKAAARVLDMGPRLLVVKRGEYGAMLFDSSSVYFVPAYPLEDEVDPTGAGDSFAGALMGALAKTGDLNAKGVSRALMTASTVASFCVEGVGTTRLREVTFSDVEARLAELHRLISLS